jgi:hypothetical protein
LDCQKIHGATTRAIATVAQAVAESSSAWPAARGFPVATAADETALHEFYEGHHLWRLPWLKSVMIHLWPLLHVMSPCLALRHQRARQFMPQRSLGAAFIVLCARIT